ncbi:unnamed protein product [Adineta steineri]|uniref:Tudor domain-containing protein n=1 Tax=Adineta steineri TaxID=433720 RepID=A0A814IW12_9BILA|nr:unnamed protein product [Adineta steineri]CAF1064342.1 unnamed protein product [Adineta steineri]
MTYESNGTLIIDEIDRLFIVCDKAKEYLSKISSGIDQQIELWQYRRQIILDQVNSVSSFDFLLPKTQRVNELSIEAVQALCRVDLLIEQILRIEPKTLVQSRSVPMSTSFSARSIDANSTYATANTSLSRIRHPIPSPPSSNSIKQQAYVEPMINGKTMGQPTFPAPVLRTSQQSSGNRLSLAATQEKAGFKPIEQQQSSIMTNSASRPTPIHPQNTHHIASEEINSHRSMAPSYDPRTPLSDHNTSPMAPPPTSQMIASYPQMSRGKVKVKLQRIAPGTKWKQAKIDVIDSLSAFYVENLDDKVHGRFHCMVENLHDYYSSLEKSNNLIPLQNISIGDFGVAKYSEDNRWYRARLLMCEEHDQIRIVFIDFGNIETKYLNQFYPLDKLYTDLPAQAIACSLSEAFPRSPNDSEVLWPQDTIQIFRQEVTEKVIEICFASLEEGTEQWPLHFVRINVGNQSVTNLLNLKQRIEPRPNRFIAEQLATSLTHQEYILFNVPISEDEFEQ